ncbi:hypothetical protein [Clostridium tagluense]|uniref:Antirepressor protein C-terminal domain-containing protein n=1 Tax=Clostridium tagluense TaxID=360422 RepID=A0A401ULL2_9CLOT|nr:hypothetical protein [Clostridium tagluense]GCD10418.1 hypothetical protein Ctaglu_20410 [Clostridium tagluense]
MLEGNELLEQKELREKAISRIEVLDKVGDLLLLPNTEKATTTQVATYYGVDRGVIENYYKLSKYQYIKEELESDGMKLYSYSEITNEIGNNFKTLQDNGLKIPTRGTYLFPKRAILRMGMLLRDSLIAKEIRTRLLDVIQDVEKESPQIIHNVVQEISEEKQIMLDRITAEMDGNYDKVCECNAKLFALKNKRIKELEVTNDIIITNALTIMESRDVINRLVRNISMKEYNGMFGMAYGELYTKVNYKLGINIKARDKKKSESYLHTLTQDETYKVEKIVRSWAVKLGLNVEHLLKLA